MLHWSNPGVSYQTLVTGTSTQNNALSINGVANVVANFRQATFCPWPPGHPSFCRDCGPCGVGGADCDGDAQCEPGLVCSNDVGANYGLPAHYDVCEQP